MLANNVSFHSNPRPEKLGFESYVTLVLMRHLFVYMALFFFSCSDEKRILPYGNNFYSTLAELSEEKFQSAYTSIKENNELKRKCWEKEITNTNDKKKLIKKARDHFYSTITDSIFMYWYGTEWDFNGITQKPREGNIACGYFVTTTLSHCGLKVERAHLAQQPASNIIKTVCKESTIKTFSNGNLKGLMKHMKNSKDGLFIIGLDNHVGFVDKRDTALYMIHSSGMSPFEVTIERMEESNPIIRSQLHMVGSITENDDLFVKWIGGEKIITIE